METALVYGGNLGIMGKKMEITIVYWGTIVVSICFSIIPILPQYILVVSIFSIAQQMTLISFCTLSGKPRDPEENGSL